jgi:hypothetical protein
MLPGVREFLRTKAGKSAAVALAVVAVAIVIWSVWSTSGGGSVVAAANERFFVDATTKKPFRHELKAGEMIPIPAPSGQKTGYPAELCYWTKDGKPKDEPTPVLLKSWIGEEGPTFCPDCDRLVVERNPYPEPGARTPPTQAEFNQRRAAGG